MAEITLGDLLRWDRGYIYLPPADQSDDAGRDTVITWAVTIRATPPILPAIRGGEIVIVPPRILQAIEATESIDRAELLRSLARQPISALLVDSSFAESPVEGVPLVLASGITASETESMLNRLLTERRAELYRLGSELTRALSSASMAGAGLAVLLNAASAVSGRPLLHFGANGTLLAGTMRTSQPAGLRPEAIAELAQTADTPRLAGSPEEPWLTFAFQIGGGRDARQRRHVLAVRVNVGSSHEVERLILTHVATAAEVVLGQAAHAQGSAAAGRANREALLTELLLGRLVSREAIDARARLLGLDPAEPARVALIRSRQSDLVARARGHFADERGRATAMLGEHEFAVVTTGAHRDAGDLRDLHAAFRAIRAADDSASMVIGDVVNGVAATRAALNQARVTGRLLDQGAIDGPIVETHDAATLGVFGLLLPLADGDGDSGMWRDRIGEFAAGLLEPLAEHDVRRGSELIDTLAAYLRSGGALAQAAGTLGVHRNTLSYRIGRIEDLTGRELADPRTRYLFQVALDARMLAQALAE